MFATAFKSLEEFRVARWAKGLNRVVQIGLSLALVIGLNLLAARHFDRWDLTTNRRFSLSAETRDGILGEIPRGRDAPPVELILTLSANDPNPAKAQQNEATLRELSGLLREYKFAAQAVPGGGVPLQVEELDMYRKLKRADELRANGLSTETAILVKRGARAHSLGISDLYAVDADGQPTAFLGERAVTSAILDVIQERPEKIYFTRGHGEINFRDTKPYTGASELAKALRQRNFVLEELDLSTGADVPADASLVVILGPQQAFHPLEVEKLRRYLNQRSGRVAAFLLPGTTPGLRELFYEWGIASDDMLVFDRAAGSADLEGDMVLHDYAKPSHPITQFLAQKGLNVRFGASRPARWDIASPVDERRRVTDLIMTTKEAWGIREWPRRNTPDPLVDLRGPISVAAIAEFSPQGALGLSLNGGRLVVFGDTAFVTNSLFGLYGNSQLAINTVNYLLDRQNRLNIPPKPPFQFQLGLSRTEQFGLAWRLSLLPAAVALLGGIVYFLRHR